MTLNCMLALHPVFYVTARLMLKSLVLCVKLDTRVTRRWMLSDQIGRNSFFLRVQINTLPHLMAAFAFTYVNQLVRLVLLL